MIFLKLNTKAIFSGYIKEKGWIPNEYVFIRYGQHHVYSWPLLPYYFLIREMLIRNKKNYLSRLVKNWAIKRSLYNSIRRVILWRVLKCLNIGTDKMWVGPANDFLLFFNGMLIKIRPLVFVVNLKISCSESYFSFFVGSLTNWKSVKCGENSCDIAGAASPPHSWWWR